MRTRALIWALVSLVACAADPGPADPKTGPDDDTGGPGGAGPADVCGDLGLTTRPWQEGGAADDFEALAADLVVETTTGNLSLAESWTGCDVWLLVNIDADAGEPADFLDERGLRDLLELSPPNVHYLLMFSERDPGTRQGHVDALDSALSAALARLDEGDAGWWAERVHVATDRSYEADWFGALITSYGGFANPHPSGVAIDRFQRLREVGYWCDPLTGWETCDPLFAAYEAVYHNFASDRQEAMDAAGATELDLIVEASVSDPGWAGQRTYADVAVPDLTGFDTLELELELDCVDRPERRYCPPWDYLVNLTLCDEDDPATPDTDESEQCGTEVGRWVTTYWRPGRWVHDVTPLMALLGDGGTTRRFAFYSQQEYVTTLRLRLSDQGKGVRPVAAEKLYTGGRFDWRYNWGRTVDIDATGIVMSVMEGHEEAFTTVSRDDDAGVLVARNGSGNSWDRGSFSRFDWAWDDAGGLWLCHAIADAPEAEVAAGYDHACAEDDPGTPDVDESTQCTGADPADLVGGCNMGAWTPLSVADGRDPAGALDGAWLEIWHESKRDRTFTPPAGTARVALVGVISGHGFGDTSANCAEFCDHQHAFSFNGAAPHTYTNPWIGDNNGCAEQVADGVVPNQSGTWVYGRGGWCPGQEVPQWVVDVTADVVVGQQNTVSYRGTHAGGYWSARSTGARIDMNSWVVYYE